MKSNPTVLIIAHDYPPIASTGVERALKFVRYLPEFGFTPIVLTTGRYGGLPRDEQDRIFRASDLVDRAFRPLKRSRIQHVAPEDQYRVATFGNRTLAGRLRDAVMVPDTKIGWLWNATRLGRDLAERYHPALVFSTSAPETAHLIARNVSRAAAIPWVADLRDGWLFEPPNPHVRRGRLRRAIEGLMEASMVASAAAVVTATAPITTDLQQRYPAHAGKIITITNGYDPEEFTGLSRQRLPDGVYLLTHTGALSGSREGTSAAAFYAGVARFRQQHPNAALRIQVVGDTRASEQAGALAAGLDDIVKFESQVSRRAAHQIQLDADALLLITAPGQRSVATLKLFDYIGAGVPILALAEDNAAAEIVCRFELGVTAPPDDPAAIADALARLIERQASAAGWPGFAEAQRDFDRRYLTGDLAALFERVIARGPDAGS
jgi:glycosyltransferase involved in cell wall biosynthesis